MSHKKYTIIIYTILIMFSFIFADFAFAQGLKDTFTGHKLTTAAKEMGYETGDTEIGIKNIVSIIIDMVLSLLGVVFLALLIYGGFTWMTARGNEQQVEKAMGIIYMSMIGLFIILAAYTISYFVIANLSAGVLKLN